MPSLFFDLDDTLLDATGMMIDCVDAVATRFSARLSDTQLARLADVYLRANLDAWRSSTPADPRFTLESIWQLCWKRVVTELAIEIPLAELLPTYREARAAEHARLFPEAPSVLATLAARGYRLGLITNGPRELQRRKLADTGLCDHLDPILISQEVGYAKPDPRIFQEAARRAGSEPASCAMIGDMLFADISGGRASGWHAIWVRRAWPAGPGHEDPAQQDEDHRPHRVVNDLTGLLEIF
ncbi:MAG: HAD family hydrolase [Armatimonadetes bacterium]|nr:HAD family hydrolase [Armatimonadota bacterium]